MSHKSLTSIFHGAGVPLEMRPIELPEVRDGEALVRVSCCTLCGSDLSTLAGHRSEPVPCVLGHEIIGIVEATGPEPPRDLRGKPVSAGDRVLWSVAASCDTCRNCRRGFPQKCVNLRKYGHHRLDDSWQLSGGLAEYCHLIPGTKLLVIDNAQSDERMCPAGCATATVAAALRAAGDLSSARVLVLGAGMLGLTASAMLKQVPGTEVTLCDLSPDRLAKAKVFGADQVLLWEEWIATLESERQSPVAEEDQFDVVLEMSGNSEAVQASLEVAATGGQIILVGSVRPSPVVAMNPERVVRRLQSIRGVHNYAPQDLVHAVDFLCGGGQKYPFETLVSLSRPLDMLNQTIDELLTPGATRPIRIAVRP